MSVGSLKPAAKKRGRTYHFSQALDKRFHMEAEYIRTRGFTLIQQEQMVIEYVRRNGRITRSDAAALCQISLYQASRLLITIKKQHPEFQPRGVGRGTHYIWTE
jgi:ATP-dependent DNA helicase RecG